MEEKQLQILTALRQITEQVSGAADFDRAVGQLVTSIRKTLGADCCSLYLNDARGQFLHLAATEGLAKAAVGKVSLRFGEGLVGVVARTQQVLDLADAAAHPNFKYLPEVGEDELLSFLGVPVMYEGRLQGVLVIQSKVARQFGPPEESFLVTLAAQVGSIIAVNKWRNAGDAGSRRYDGKIGTGGVAIARAILWQAALALDDVPIIYTEDRELQAELYRQAVFQLQTEMDRHALKMREEHQVKAAFGYMSGYGKFLEDGDLQEAVEGAILHDGLTASAAVKVVLGERLKAADAALADDLRDFGQVVLARLVHATGHDLDAGERLILAVKSLPTAWVAELPREQIAGFVCVDSGTSAHTTILARELGIPAVIGVPIDLNRIDGRLVIVDGGHARVIVEPSPSVVGEYEQLAARDREQRNLVGAELNEPGITIDRHRIAVRLNAGLNRSEDKELPQQTDGIGLYRTEIDFMLGQTFPTEQQQSLWYEKLLAQFQPLPVCMRTLDVGGDKNLEYLPIREQNPAMGWRGVRVTTDQPQILKTQLRAMMRAHRRYGNLEIMVPMVSRIEEVQAAREMVTAAYEEVCAQEPKLAPPRFGVMIEVPGTVYIMADLAPLADFFSIGSNDLIQYLLAVDRANPKVSRLFDPFHPGVVRCLDTLKRQAEACQRPIAVCGEIAGHPLGALLLLALGYDMLSMNYSELGRIKYLVRRVSVTALREIGQRALRLKTAAAVRALFTDYAVAQGLGRLLTLTEDGRD